MDMVCKGWNPTHSIVTSLRNTQGTKYKYEPGISVICPQNNCNKANCKKKISVKPTTYFLFLPSDILTWQWLALRTWTISPLYSRLPVSLDTVTKNQHAQYHGPKTRSTNSAAISRSPSSATGSHLYSLSLFFQLFIIILTLSLLWH